MSDDCLRQVEDDLAGCTRCALHAGRTNIVFGVGNPCARILLVGEGPGEREDLTGEPFVGRAGMLLDRLLREAGLSRANHVFIANIVKCRPPGNRDPKPEEVAVCYPFLRRQIEIIRPKVIFALGKVAANRLTLQYGSMAALMALPQDRLLHADSTGRKTPVVPVYHPSYLLRLANLSKEKAKPVFEDFIGKLAGAAL